MNFSFLSHKVNNAGWCVFRYLKHTSPYDLRFLRQRKMTFFFILLQKLSKLIDSFLFGYWI